MKLLWGFAVLGMMILSQNVFAAEKLSAVEGPAGDTAPKAVVAPKIDEKKMKKMRELVEEKKKEINGSEWKVTLGSNDPKAKAGADVLRFQDDMVTLESFSKQGFGPTNYTISVPSEESEVAVFETMQTGKEGNIIFIRGEWKKDSMQGVVNEQLEGGKQNREYWFSSSGKNKISPVSEKKPEEKTSDVEEVPAVNLSSKEDGSRVKTPSKAKADKEKGWF